MGCLVSLAFRMMTTREIQQHPSLQGFLNVWEAEVRRKVQAESAAGLLNLHNAEQRHRTSWRNSGIRFKAEIVPVTTSVDPQED